MRKAFRKSSAVVLALAIVAILGGTIPSHAALYSMSVVGVGKLSAEQDIADKWGTTVEVSKISTVKPDGPDSGTTPDTLTATSVKLVYTPTGGAPQELTQSFTNTAVPPAVTNIPTKHTFTIPGPLVKDTDYDLVAYQYDDATPTPNVISVGFGRFSVRTPSTIVVTVESETVQLPGNPLFAGLGGSQLVTALLKDASGAAIVGQNVTINTQGGLLGTTLAPCGKTTGGDGKMSCRYEGGNILVPGTYTSEAKALVSYSYDPVAKYAYNFQYTAPVSAEWAVVAAL
jgi:hypothetical protein